MFSLEASDVTDSLPPKNDDRAAEKFEILLIIDGPLPAATWPGSTARASELGVVCLDGPWTLDAAESRPAPGSKAGITPRLIESSGIAKRPSLPEARGACRLETADCVSSLTAVCIGHWGAGSWDPLPCAWDALPGAWDSLPQVFARDILGAGQAANMGVEVVSSASDDSLGARMAASEISVIKAPFMSTCICRRSKSVESVPKGFSICLAMYAKAHKINTWMKVKAKAQAQ